MKKLLKRIRVAWLLTFRYRFRQVGSRFYCGRSLFVRPNTVTVGHDVYFGRFCHLAVCDLRVGNHVMFAPCVAVVGGDHDFGQVGVPIRYTGRSEERPVVVEDDVWVGYGSIILQGVTLGEGSIVAAGSVVTKDVLPYTIVGGNPARHLRDRFNNDAERNEHSNLIGGRYSHDEGN